MIYDWFDDPTLGVVDYVPYLLSPPPCCMLGPEIDVTPTAFSVTLAAGLSTSGPMTIENTGSLSLTFNITDTVDGAPVDWLTETPSAGAVPPGGSDVVTVAFDASGLTAGVHTATIFIANNDLDENQVRVPVTMTIGDDGSWVVGTVCLQGRPACPDPSWSIPLTFTMDSTVYTVTTDECGVFTQTGILPGTYYTLGVEGWHTLRNEMYNVTLLPGENRIDLCCLLEGNANRDGIVDISDFSILAGCFFQPPSVPGCENADFNEDGYIDISDFSLMAASFFRVSPIECTSSGTMATLSP
jgi:hypothetical protein